MAVFLPSSLVGELVVSGTVTLSLDQRPVADARVQFGSVTERDYVYATMTGPDGSYSLRLQPSTVIAEQRGSADVEPLTTWLGAAYPNPFNPSARIPLTIAQPGPAKLVVFNSGGQMVRVLIDTELAAGAWQFEWEGLDDAGRPVAAGTYIYHLQTPGFAASRKMTLLDGAGIGHGGAAKPTAVEDGPAFTVTISRFTMCSSALFCFRRTR